MPQQIIALIIIAFFLSRLYWQKRKKYIGANEFLFYMERSIIPVLSLLPWLFAFYP